MWDDREGARFAHDSRPGSVVIGRNLRRGTIRSVMNAMTMPRVSGDWHDRRRRYRLRGAWRATHPQASEGANELVFGTVETRHRVRRRWSATGTPFHHAVWILLLVSGCFHPIFDHPRCGPNGECPGGTTCSAQLICEDLGPDAASADATNVDAAAAASGCWTIATSNPVFHVSACVDPAGITDTADVSSNTSIDTDTGISNPPGLALLSHAQLTVPSETGRNPIHDRS